MYTESKHVCFLKAPDSVSSFFLSKMSYFDYQHSLLPFYLKVNLIVNSETARIDCAYEQNNY